MSEAATFEEILPLIEEPKDTLILFHRAPDADAVGSAFALRQVLEELGSRAWCVCTDEVPARLAFLMHALQPGVTADAVPEDFSAERILSVDTASPTQLDALFPLYGDRVDLMLDHHESGEPYAKFHYIRPEAAATGELIFDLVKTLAKEGRVTITDALCTDLYAAISGDTGGFRFSNVTPKTHLRAAELLSSGIDGAMINHLLFDSKSIDVLRAEAAGISNLNLYADGTVAVITFPYALKVALGLEDEHLSTLIDVARSVSGVKLAFCIRQPELEGRFRVSARSSCDYDVAALCQHFGGGGHRKAAGCTVTATDMTEATEKILKELDFSALN